MENGSGQAASTNTAPITSNGDAVAPQGGGTQSTQTQGSGNLLKDAAQQAARKLKIDDQEVDETEVIETYKKRKGHQAEANKRLQEGIKAQKKAEKFIEMMKDKNQLFNTLKELGHDPRALSEEYLASILEEEMLDPKEREVRTYKKQLEEYKAKEQKQKEADENKIREQLKEKYAKEYSNQFVDALKTTGLPPTKETVAKVAAYIKKATTMNFEMTPLEAAKLVREDMELTHKSILSSADAELLVKILGDEGLQKIRSYDVSKLRDPSAHLKTPAEQGEAQRKRDPSAKRMTPAEWRAFNRK